LRTPTRILREYHESMGEVIFRYEGTLERFLAVEGLAKKWARKSHDLGFALGIASGYATLGQVGFEHRCQYTANGSVINLASRLCDEAKSGQIVISQRAFGAIERWVKASHIGQLRLKGFNRPIDAYEYKTGQPAGAIVCLESSGNQILPGRPWSFTRLPSARAVGRIIFWPALKR
jgi:hypothetical protein